MKDAVAIGACSVGKSLLLDIPKPNRQFHHRCLPVGVEGNADNFLTLQLNVWLGILYAARSRSRG